MGEYETDSGPMDALRTHLKAARTEAAASSLNRSASPSATFANSWRNDPCRCPSRCPSAPQHSNHRLRPGLSSLQGTRNRRLIGTAAAM